MEYINKGEKTRKEFMQEAKLYGYDIFTADVVKAFQTDFIAKSKSGELSDEERLEKAVELNDLKRQVVVNDDLTKSLLFYREPLVEWIDKAQRTGRYADNPTNRRLHRVGQPYKKRESHGEENGEEKHSVKIKRYVLGDKENFDREEIEELQEEAEKYGVKIYEAEKGLYVIKGDEDKAKKFGEEVFQVDFNDKEHGYIPRRGEEHDTAINKPKKASIKELNNSFKDLGIKFGRGENGKIVDLGDGIETKDGGYLGLEISPKDGKAIVWDMEAGEELKNGVSIEEAKKFVAKKLGKKSKEGGKNSGTFGLNESKLSDIIYHSPDVDDFMEEIVKTKFAKENWLNAAKFKESDFYKKYDNDNWAEAKEKDIIEDFKKEFMVDKKSSDKPSKDENIKVKKYSFGETEGYFDDEEMMAEAKKYNVEIKQRKSDDLIYFVGKPDDVKKFMLATADVEDRSAIEEEWSEDSYNLKNFG